VKPTQQNPAQQQKSKTNKTTPKAGRVEVFLRHANAHVLLNGSKTTSTGHHRIFKTPALTPGKQYMFHVVATWTHDGQEMREEHRVHLTAGGTARVHFHHGHPVSGQTDTARGQPSDE
jgi:uncharacterized protein (TIGR03000 family)